MSEEARTGSYADLARRVDGVEKTVTNLTGTVVRVELNQQHAEELTKLRFDAIDSGMRTLGLQLNEFIRRVEAIMAGEVVTPQSRRGEEIVKDYEEWRDGLEKWRETVKDRFIAEDSIAGDRDKRAATLARNWAVAGSVIGSIVGGMAFLLVQLMSSHP